MAPQVIASERSVSHEIHHENLSFPEKLDKINQTLNHLTELSDLEKLEFFMVASQILTDESPKRSRHLAQQGLALAKKTKQISKAVFFTIKLLELSDPKPSASHKQQLQQAKAQLERLPPSYDKSWAYLIYARTNGLSGDRYEQLSSLYDGLTSGKQCGSACDAICTHRILGLLNNELSNYYRSMNKLEKSRTFLQQALNNFEAINDRSKIGVVLFNLGLTESKLGHHKLAIDHFKDVIEIKVNLKENFGYALSHMHLGQVKTSQGQPAAGLEHLNTAIPILIQSEALGRLAAAHLYQGHALHGLQRQDEANMAYLKSLDIAEKHLSPKHQFNLYQSAQTHIDSSAYPDRHDQLTQLMLQAHSTVIEEITNDIQERTDAENKLSQEQLEPLNTQPNRDYTVWLAPLMLLVAVLLWGIFKLRKANNKNLKLANTDDLTGILNRRSFFQHMKQTSRSDDDQHQSYLIFLDIDHFKAINDQFGHSVGDQVLVTMTQLINAHLPETSAFGRIGGEEFAIVAQFTDQPSVNAFAEQIRQSIEAHDWSSTQHPSLGVTISIGITPIQENQEILNAYNQADKALYTAKQRGRNTICFA